jgi:hypothetical protein
MADKETSPSKAAAGNKSKIDAVLADEKATAKSKRDRVSGPSKSDNAVDPLSVGGGQQTTPYQLETQADAIAKQSRRGKS